MRSRDGSGARRPSLCMQMRTTIRVMYAALAIASVQPLAGCSPEPGDAELGIYRGSAERAEQEADGPPSAGEQPVPGASSAAGSAAAAGGAGSAADVSGSDTGTDAAGAAGDSSSGATGGGTATDDSSAIGGGAASAGVATAGSGASGDSGAGGSSGAGDSGAGGAVDYCATQDDPRWQDWKAVLTASAPQICAGECVGLTASTTAAPAPSGYAWRKGFTVEEARNAGENEPLLGPGPHSVCPTQTTTYEVSAYYFACEEFGYEAVASTTIVVTPACP